MIAPLGTLVFLGLLWLVVVLGSAVLEGNGAKIIAALEGRSRPAPTSARTKIRIRARGAVTKCSTPPLRAAA